MCDILGKEQPNSILQAAVADKVFLEADDGPEDVLFFRIFGNMEFQYASSTRVQPTLCFVETSAFS